MFIQFFFTFQLAMASYDIKIQSVQYQSLMDSPSCELLYHRQLERSKVIREAIYLLGLDEESSQAKIMQQNTLITNKLFLDKNIWEDLITEVTITAQIDSLLLKAINSEGLDKLYFSIKGPGLAWSSLGSSMSEDIKFDYSTLEQKIIISYPIYKGDECQKENVPVEIHWSGPYDDWSLE